MLEVILEVSASLSGLTMYIYSESSTLKYHPATAEQVRIFPGCYDFNYYGIHLLYLTLKYGTDNRTGH
jgi:hypothetical protein